MFDIKSDAMIFCLLNIRTSAGSIVCRIVGGLGEELFLQSILRISCHMLVIKKITSVGICIWAPTIAVVSAAGPNSSNARTELIGCCITATTAAPSAGVSQYILDGKILFVDIICLT